MGASNISLKKKRSSKMFGAAHRLAAMEAKWQRDRLVWISNKKIVELGTNPSDKMLHKTVLVRNTHSALTSWDRELFCYFQFFDISYNMLVRKVLASTSICW